LLVLLHALMFPQTNHIIDLETPLILNQVQDRIYYI